MLFKYLIYRCIYYFFFHFVQIIQMFTQREQINILNIGTRISSDKPFT